MNTEYKKKLAKMHHENDLIQTFTKFQVQLTDVNKQYAIHKFQNEFQNMARSNKSAELMLTLVLTACVLSSAIPKPADGEKDHNRVVEKVGRCL